MTPNEKVKTIDEVIKEFICLKDISAKEGGFEVSGFTAEELEAQWLRKTITRRDKEIREEERNRFAQLCYTADTVEDLYHNIFNEPLSSTNN